VSVREVTSPDGVSWRVEIDWVARRIRNPLRRVRSLTRGRRRSGIGDSLDIVSPLADLPGPVGGIFAAIADVLLLIVAVVFVVWVAPVLVAAAALLAEFFFVTFAAVAILGWRTMLRRPWRVGAWPAESGEHWTLEVVGYRRARRLVRELADGLAHGRSPADLGRGVSEGVSGGLWGARGGVPRCCCG
jgi:hypothetical protein